MSEQNNMDELLELTGKIARRQRVNTVLCIVVLLALIAACCFAGYRVSQTVQQFEESITRIDTASEEIRSFFGSFEAAGYESPEQAIRDLHDTTETINDILSDISENGIFGLGGLSNLPGLGGLGNSGSSDSAGSADAEGSPAEDGSATLGESMDEMLNQAMEWLGGLFGGGNA
ncbi:MAG: hypothetical protein IJV40_14700 [Oscillospiraceae bacterium]|nr:hypothetical protein [Oscillospiraceae bacterium]